jgi:hypothetical protein
LIVEYIRYTIPPEQAGAFESSYGPRPWPSSTRKLHNRLHIHHPRLNLQVDVNTKAPTCGAFAEPSDGLEPSTPSLPWRCSTN